MKIAACRVSQSTGFGEVRCVKRKRKTKKYIPTTNGSKFFDITIEHVSNDRLNIVSCDGLLDAPVDIKRDEPVIIVWNEDKFT